MKFREVDLKQLINKNAYAVYSECLYLPTFEKYRDEMTLFSADPSFRAFVYIEEDAYLGIVVLKLLDPDTAEISGVAVAKDRRRQRIGTLLLFTAALSLNVKRFQAEAGSSAIPFFEHAGFSASSIPDGKADRFLFTLDMDSLPGLTILPSGKADLENIRSLWADPDVMRYVGYPDGYQVTPSEMEQLLDELNSRRPLYNHYCVFFRGVFCGEATYNIHKNCGLAEVHMALFPFARGKGLASKSVRFLMEQAFAHGAVKCYVTPNSANKAAVALYSRLGMVPKEMPKDLDDFMRPESVYMETVSTEIRQK